MRRPSSFLVLLVLGACAKPIEPAKLADFVGAPGKLEAACVEANDGKRFLVEGHLAPNGDVAVTDGRVTLGLYAAIADGEGQDVPVVMQLKEHTHVDFAATDTKSTFRGGAVGSEGKLAGITLHTTSGDATPADRLAVVFDVEVLRQFQTQEITACTYKVAELRVTGR